MQSTTPYPTKAKTQAGGVGAPRNLCYLIISLASRGALTKISSYDVLTVTRPDRLARSTRDLLNTLATITGKGAGSRPRARFGYCSVACVSADASIPPRSRARSLFGEAVSMTIYALVTGTLWKAPPPPKRRTL
jgi:resolvase-like protein